jgi:hypothetical protein
MFSVEVVGWEMDPSEYCLKKGRKSGDFIWAQRGSEFGNTLVNRGLYKMRNDFVI